MECWKNNKVKIFFETDAEQHPFFISLFKNSIDTFPILQIPMAV
jgi:hypothetical protein